MTSKTDICIGVSFDEKNEIDQSDISNINNNKITHFKDEVVPEIEVDQWNSGPAQYLGD